MSDVPQRRAGWSLAELALDARGLDPRELAGRYSPGFLLRQSGTGALAPAVALMQTMAGTLTSTRDEPSRNLLDYQVFPLRRAGASRFGGDYIGVGRGENNDVVIEHASISKFHAFMVQEAAGFSISDAGSKNGTFLNDERVGSYRDVRPASLRDGDRIRLGDVRLTYVGAEAFWRLLRRAG